MWLLAIVNVQSNINNNYKKTLQKLIILITPPFSIENLFSCLNFPGIEDLHYVVNHINKFLLIEQVLKNVFVSYGD